MTGENGFAINTSKIVYDTLDGEVIIINFETGNYYSMNSMGKEIWNFLEANLSYNEIADAIAKNYAGRPEGFKEELSEFIENLKKEELIYEEASNKADKKITTEALTTEKLKYEKPGFFKYTDMKEMLLLDPIHDVDETGWPSAKVPAKQKKDPSE